MIPKFFKKPPLSYREIEEPYYSRFSDEIAGKTVWTQMGDNGNLNRRKPVEVNADRIEFRMTFEALAFYLFFLFGGIVSIFLVLQNPISFSRLILLCGGAAFIIMGTVMLRNGTAPIVMDKSVGFFWKGRETPNSSFQNEPSQNRIRLEEIYALQLIASYSSGEECTRKYEINMVLKDGRRIHIMDHRRLQTTRKHAALLSRFLQKPVWDALQQNAMHN